MIAPEIYQVQIRVKQLPNTLGGGLNGQTYVEKKKSRKKEFITLNCCDLLVHYMPTDLKPQPQHTSQSFANHWVQFIPLCITINLSETFS